MNERVFQDQTIRPVCVVNSLPKSGTHLLKKVINFLPGMVAGDFHLGPRPSDLDAYESTNLRSKGSLPPTIPVGVGRPRLMPRDEIYWMLSALKERSFITAHVPFSPELALLLHELNIKMVTIIRDPRDVAVSQAKFVASRPQNPLFDHYQPLSESERIMIAIVGIREAPPGPILRNIQERLESVLLWRSQPFNFMTSFERLVGPQGGGSRERQLKEISMITCHLGLSCSSREVELIADSVFGDTDTFFRGVIGSWREHFTEEHKQACKKLVGQWLIDLGYELNLDW
jgi:sulfotransferase 6B1